MSQKTSRPGMEGPMLAFRFMDLAPILLEALKFSVVGRFVFWFLFVTLVRPLFLVFDCFFFWK